ncbi:MAG: hypothetical protein KDD32_03050 [Bacteroidetes bacterium]|nr:hypothetical protein [Bacteroidota bacterium]
MNSIDGKMKNEVIQTKTVKSILQVHHHYIEYGKDQKSFTDRKEQSEWLSKIASYTAFSPDHRLILPFSIDHTGLLNGDLVVLNDFNTATEAEALALHRRRWHKDLIYFGENEKGEKEHHLQHVQCFSFKNNAPKYDIFQFKLVDDQIELHLRYDYYEVGQPKRDNFKLCVLEKDVPVEIKINGKLDHSLSSGRARTYKEHHYIFHLLGNTDNFEIQHNSRPTFRKTIPAPLKVIDLMKRLY